MTMLNPGELLVERYRIASHIGSGGDGNVWLATDERTGACVAAKQYHNRGQMLRERACLQAVSSPRVVRYIDCDESRRTVIREYVDGPTLTRASVDGAKVAREVAEATHAVTLAGFLYADPNPENIVISPRGAVLIDLGKCISWLDMARYFKEYVSWHEVERMFQR